MQKNRNEKQIIKQRSKKKKPTNKQEKKNPKHTEAEATNTHKQASRHAASPPPGALPYLECPSQHGAGSIQGM